MRHLLIALLLVPAAALHAQAEDLPQLHSVWWEDVIGNPEGRGQTGRTLRQVTGDTRIYRWENGQYKSTIGRIKLKLPRLQDETAVTVREAIAMKRPDGEVATAHVVIIPGRMSMAPVRDNQAMSAIVVTRLRDDRPKDRESILRQWEPPTAAEAERYRSLGIATRRIQLPPFGESVERIVRNRASVEPFPYKMNILAPKALETVGVTRFVVAGEDSLIEFSQILPCDGRPEDECTQAALAAADRFVGGVSEFLMYPMKK